MNHILLSIKIICLTCICALTSCETTINHSNLNVHISNVCFDGQNLNFTITATGADRLSYTVFPVSAGDGHENFSESTTSCDITVPGIIPDEKYVIRARAYAADRMEEEIIVHETLFSETPYFKTVLITKFTGTWCGWCPDMTTSLHELENIYPGQITILALHGGDDLENSGIILPLEERFGIIGYPTSVFDYQYSSTQQMIMLKDRMEKTLSENTALAGIAIQTAVSDNRITVTADAEFGASGNWRICCALAENDIYRENTSGSKDGYYDHVVRDFATNPEGDDVGKIISGSSKSFEWSFQLDEDWQVNNCDIVVFLLRENQDGIFTVNNANCCKAGSSVNIRLKE